MSAFVSSEAAHADPQLPASRKPRPKSKRQDNTPSGRTSSVATKPVVLPWLNRRHTAAARSSQRATVFRCVEMVEELIYGHLRKEQLVEHWEGDYGRRGGTLVIDITRRPSSEPDL